MFVPVRELRRLIVARLEQHFPPDAADRMADAVLFGDLAGRSTHGIARILPGSFGPTDEPTGPPPRVERTGPSAARINGSPGMLVAAMATDLTIELASEHGIALVTTAGSRSTSGSLTYYAERLTNAGLVGILSANTMSFVTPPGGTARTFGTNPFAIGIPTTPDCRSSMTSAPPPSASANWRQRGRRARRSRTGLRSTPRVR
jgi:LDH2 family malate/lactate/ureidoglycolate dehydrogenase